MKIIPVFALLILLKLTIFDSEKGATNKSFVGQMSDLFFEFVHSFNFSDIQQVAVTFLILVTIWTGYKFWLTNFRVIRNNSKLTEQVLFALSLVVFEEHVRYDSVLGHALDYAIFLVLVYAILAGTWLLAKIIDSFDLSQDLNCWGLRIVGLAMMGFGFMIFAGGSMVSLAGEVVSTNIFWIAGMCIIALGAFSEYRSFRRHGVFVYMR
ncbi:hypothetical protein [Methanococcoides sp. FTZ1]|uniref:hypothetical protein n=1 Tax=Methanococcoides sp. FTZ1 TaxID=3439061 RepID=UPI003F84F21E